MGLNIYVTEYKAVNENGELRTFSGDRIEAISFSHAEHIINNTNRSHLTITGRLISEIPCDENYKPDWSKRIDYDYDLN